MCGLYRYELIDGNRSLHWGELYGEAKDVLRRALNLMRAKYRYMTISEEQILLDLLVEDE